MSKSYELAQKAALDRQSEAFDHLLEAYLRYEHPLPMLGPQHSKDSRLARALLEVLLDQLYPRELWKRVAFEEWEAQDKKAA